MLENWSEDRSAIARAVLMTLLAFLAVCLTINHSCWTPFAALDLVIHEVGHYFGFNDTELREIESEVRAARRRPAPKKKETD